MAGFLLVSFAAGALTVLAPCILPLLPVIVGGSVAAGSARRATVIVAALGASVFAFTLLLKATTALITIPPIFWQLLSGTLLLLFGIATLSPALWERVPLVSRLYVSSNRALGAGYRTKGLMGDIVMGAALGPVFSSCSPTYFVILATALPASFAVGTAYLLAYVVGLCLCLTLVALVGRRAVALLGVASTPNSWFKKVIGVIFIVVGVAVIFGWDKTLEAALPQGSFAEIGIEQALLSSGAASSTPLATATTTASTGAFLTPQNKALLYPPAPELAGIAGYINTDGQPINLAQYRGKDVVLIDFWDYSCINCQRTTPYLNAWYQKYKDQGLVIIGVHTPEFAFEQLQSNVEAAVEKAGIMYPVVLDNTYQTWNAFQNQYWPNEYLIDIDGYVVHTHAGEGEYDQTEAAIQQALAERALRLGTGAVATSTVDVPQAELSGIQSPETYFGANRNEYLGNGTPGVAGAQTFALPDSPQGNALYLGGAWDIRPEYAEAKAGATVLFVYSASDVYMVAANPGAPATIKILRDGKPVGSAAGADANPITGEATINGDRLYKLIHDSAPGVHTIEIQVVQGTLDAYTFTFG